MSSSIALICVIGTANVEAWFLYQHSQSFNIDFLLSLVAETPFNTEAAFQPCGFIAAFAGSDF